MSDQVADVVMQAYSPVAGNGDSAAAGSELRERLAAQGVEYCIAAWVDMNGRAKGKTVPLSVFDRMIRGEAPLYSVHALEGMGDYGPMAPDQSVLPDPERALVCPWDKKYAWLPGDITWNGGEPYPLCARHALKRQVARAEALGLRFMVGLEPEFYVFRRGDDESVQPFSDLDRGPCWGYDYHVGYQASPFLHRVTETLGELGWTYSAFGEEGGHSQYEFDFGYADVLTTADRWVFLKEALKQIAQSLDAFVSFMPKPFDDAFRSGLHFNMSFVDRETGENLMRWDDDPRGYGVSKLAYQFIAGQIEHARAITAVSCPTVNSYRGLIGNIGLAGLSAGMSWAPIAVAYGPNNRSVMLRLPPGRNCVENRATDASCNIHLALAMTLGAGLDGIERGLDPGDPCLDNLYELTDDERAERGIGRLPHDLRDAIEAFNDDPLTEQILGPELKRQYRKLKLGEWLAAHHHVPESDRERYLEFF